jgi:hypothetical protein
LPDSPQSSLPRPIRRIAKEPVRSSWQTAVIVPLRRRTVLSEKAATAFSFHPALDRSVSSSKLVSPQPV